MYWCDKLGTDAEQCAVTQMQWWIWVIFVEIRRPTWELTSMSAICIGLNSDRLIKWQIIESTWIVRCHGNQGRSLLYHLTWPTSFDSLSPKHPCYTQRSRRYLLHKPSYSRFCHKFRCNGGHLENMQINPVPVVKFPETFFWNSTTY